MWRMGLGRGFEGFSRESAQQTLLFGGGGASNLARGGVCPVLWLASGGVVGYGYRLTHPTFF